jgi:hypothetical protein
LIEDIMKKILLATTLVLTACGGGGDNTPPAGEVLSTSCDDYTLIQTIADGNGGSTVSETERSPECGWNPPEAGTVKETRCDEEYSLFTVYNDGEYGTYEELTEEYSEECGWEDPVAVFDVRRSTGDRFRPVLIDVEYEQFGQPYDGEFKPELVVEEGETTIGRVSVNENKTIVYVHGDGREGDGMVTLNGDQITYLIGNEPRCPADLNVDCMGYYYSGRSTGYIYYGEEDQRMVTWEIVVVFYEAVEAGVENVNVYVEGDGAWDRAQRRINDYNEAMERSGVFIEFKLVAVLGGRFGGASIGLTQYYKLDELGIGADVAIGIGNTCDGAGGCAYVNKGFRLGNTNPLDGTSTGGWSTDLHEIGHAVGLAHGPENYANAASGYIWMEFGHGWDAFCSYYADIMSYNSSRYTFHNSTKTCGEMYGEWSRGRIEPDNTNPAGSRAFADSAYHLNRVRYDVSLINNENDWKPEEDDPLQFIKVEAQRNDRILVID